MPLSQALICFEELLSLNRPLGQTFRQALRDFIRNSFMKLTVDNSQRRWECLKMVQRVLRLPGLPLCFGHQEAQKQTSASRPIKRTDLSVWGVVWTTFPSHFLSLSSYRPDFSYFFFLSRFLLCTAPSRPWRNEKGNKERLGIRDKTKDRSLPPSPFPTFDDWAAWEGSVTLKSCYESPRPHNFKTKCIAGPFHINFSHSTLCS